ncbi:MAG TPA: hypothetical protein P5528_03570 [Steroidobacteraceae bacterium]|nr:hypothetical protein [Steroidobacteraceae bacterium]HRX88502.1 hypothetical protein [Steroidobacteraceae bacterium]
MTMPPGFLGTRADLLLDLVMISLVLVVPILVYSWRTVRGGGYGIHKTVQLSVFVVLGLAVLAFELHMRELGGIFKATKDSAYAGTAVLNGWIYVHTAFAVLMALVWIIVAIGALKFFPKPPRPIKGSAVHRWMGRLGMLLALGAGLTAIPLYIYGFAY